MKYKYSDTSKSLNLCDVSFALDFIICLIHTLLQPPEKQIPKKKDTSITKILFSALKIAGAQN